MRCLVVGLEIVGLVPTIGNLTPSGLPLLPAFSTYQEDAAAPAEPDPDDPRWHT